MNFKRLTLLLSIILLITACGDTQNFSDENLMEKKCVEKIKAKYNDIKGVPVIESFEDAEGVKLAMGKYADVTKTIVSAIFKTNDNKEQTCTCLFDEDNQFLSLLEDANYVMNQNNEIIQNFEP